MIKSEPNYEAFDYLNEKEKEVVILCEYFTENAEELLHVFKEAGETGTEFLKVVDDVKTKLSHFAHNRWQRWYLRVGIREDIKDRDSVCDTCGKISKVTVLGEDFVAEKFHFDKLQCKTCGSVFTDIFPNKDEEYAAWVESMKEWVNENIKNIDLLKPENQKLKEGLLNFQENIEQRQQVLNSRREKEDLDIILENEFANKLDGFIKKFTDMKTMFEKLH